jgi:DNA modification methylase
MEDLMTASRKGAAVALTLNTPSCSGVSSPVSASVIEQIQLGALRPYEGNPRLHNDRQIQKLVALVRAVGFLVPIIIDENGIIIAGHGRYLAAKAIGLMTVPVIRASHLTPAQVKAFRLADNRIAELSETDPRALAYELKELGAFEIEDPDILELTAYETAEIDLAIEMLDEEGETDPADEVLAPEPGPPVTRLGDVIILGRHRLLCGSSLEEVSYQRLLGEVRARTVASDPPYNIKISGHVSGLGKVRHREFAMASGEMSEQEFIAFLARYFTLSRAYSIPGALHYSFIDAAHHFELLSAARQAGLSFKITCCWAKTNAGMGSFYRHQIEYCHIFKNGGAEVAHVNNILLGRHRYRTTLWSYPGCNTFRKGRMEDLAAHPTIKPTALVADIIKDCSHRGDAILDAFCGSGTVILAAEKTGRIGYGIELDPIYCDLAIRRFEKLTGEKVIYEATGMTFDQMREARASESTRALSGEGDATAEDGEAHHD